MAPRLERAADDRERPVGGGPPRKLVEFEKDRVYGFDWSRDGKQIACVRGLWTENVVLIKDAE